MKTRKPNLRQEMEAYIGRRQHALRVHASDPSASGLVAVCCETCLRPIATTSVDRARGEPAILLDFPELARGWSCTDCSTIRRAKAVG